MLLPGVLVIVQILLWAPHVPGLLLAASTVIAFAALSCRRLAAPWALGGTPLASVLGLGTMGGALLGLGTVGGALVAVLVALHSPAVRRTAGFAAAGGVCAVLVVIGTALAADSDFIPVEARTSTGARSRRHAGARRERGSRHRGRPTRRLHPPPADLPDRTVVCGKT
ncbi:hypothetical protein ACIHFD_46280 [Nonomuraea sp. NPDC051941]|uniref:hypothetical protein n=1 Tax=Nonomuraea sp. NPDC051941 TaxID=3364373 RepID=UPI0037CC6A46